MPRHSDIEDLIRNLTELQKEVKVEEVLEAALAEPMPTEERLRQIEHALETFRELGLFGRDDSRDLHLLLTLGRTYERLSHLEKAHEVYETALALAERLEAAEPRALLMCRIGRVLSRWDRWEEALDYLDRSRRAYRELDSEQGQARVAINRGIVLQERGDYEGATGAYEEARARAERIGNGAIVANASNNLAVLATIRGDLEDAISQYEAVLAMYQEAENNRGIVRIYYNIGMTHVDRRDWNAAMDCYERGFEVAQREGYIDVMANIHLGMAEVLLELGNSVMVPFCCARALDTYRKLGDRLGEADTYRLLGRTFTLRKDWSTAESLFQDSLRLNEDYANPLGVAEAHRDLGKMQAARGRESEAQASFEAALSGFQRLSAQADVAEVERLIEELGDS